MAGVKGKSGRKTVRDEFKEVQEAYRIFFDAHDQEELEAKIATGKFSVRDRFILTAMEGDTQALLKAYQKAVPDMIDHTTKGDKMPTPLLDVLHNQRNEENSGTQEAN